MPPQLRRRHLPPKHGCSDGGVSNMSIEEIYGSKQPNIIKSKTHLYYLRMCKKISRVKRLYLKSRKRLHHVRSRRRKRASFTYIDSLPDELLFDILQRLPADDLHDKARLVCGSWCRIIRSRAFTTSYSQHPTYGLIFSPVLHRRRHSVYVTTTKGRIHTRELRYLDEFNIMASCNGLALKLSKRYTTGVDVRLQLHVINPATKKSILLPIYSLSDKFPEVYDRQCGFAYSSASKEYKVILASSASHNLPCLDIVTVGVDKSWRRVEVDHLPKDSRWILGHYAVTTEGFVHWCKGDEVLTMDVETEMISAGEGPFTNEYSKYFYYLSTGRYLSALVSEEGFPRQVWEMKPKSGEWRRLPYDIDLKEPLEHMHIAAECLFGNLPPRWVKYPEVIAFCRLTGEVFTCFFYNLETHEISSIYLRHCVYFESFVHMSSLLWLGED